MQNDDNRILPEAGKRLPLHAAVEEARVHLKEAISCLERFQTDRHYPAVTRSEAEGVIEAVQRADALAAKLDPPFIEKA